MPSDQFRESLDRLAAAEQKFLASEFLAPVVSGGQVRVRIAGVVCTLDIGPRDFEGWGVFQPTSYSGAQLVRPAGLAERRAYLELFPMVRLILCCREEDRWLAVPAHRGDTRFRIEGMVPVRLVEDTEQFAVVHTRFDGSSFWFAGADPRRNPATAAYLREALHRTLAPDRLERPGLTLEERAAYAVNYCLKDQVREAQRRLSKEGALHDALAHAGAELIDFLERRDSYRVTYIVDGQRHVSAVAKGDLTVQMAGICLSGEDRRFDLASLVGVIREAGHRGQFLRVGRENQGIEEQHYWDVHPPRNP